MNIIIENTINAFEESIVNLKSIRDEFNEKLNKSISFINGLITTLKNNINQEDLEEHYYQMYIKDKHLNNEQYNELNNMYIEGYITEQEMFEQEAIDWYGKYEYENIKVNY